MEDHVCEQVTLVHDGNDDDGLSASVSFRGIDSLDYYEWTYRRPLPFNAPAFCYPDWVHGLVGRKQIPMYDPVTHQLSMKEKTTPQEPNELRRLWDEIHSVNGFPKTGTQPQEHRDILLGKTGPSDGEQSVQWTQLLPYSEEDVVAMMIWMRENGAIASDPIPAQQAKAGVGYTMPTTKWMRCMFEYSIGGLLMALTKKTLWRLCLLALSIVFDYAVYPNEAKVEVLWPDFKVTDLTKGWTKSLSLGIPKLIPGVARHFIMGTQYNELWGARELADFTPEQLEVSATVENEDVKVNIYEYHYVLVKPRKAQESFDIPPLADDFRQVLAWQASRTTEGYPKLPPDAGCITTGFSALGSNAEHRLLQGGGPERCAAFEPVAGVFMFWQTVRRLIREEGYMIEPDSYFQEVFNLADFYIRLCQITRPSQVYDIKFPDCFTDKLPSPRPAKLDDTLRRVQRKVADEQWDVIKTWHKRMTNFKISGNLENLERARGGINLYNLPDLGKEAMSEPLEVDHFPSQNRVDQYRGRESCIGLGNSGHLLRSESACSNFLEHTGTIELEKTQPKRRQNIQVDASDSAPSSPAASQSSSSRSAATHTTPSPAQVRKHLSSSAILEELAEELTYHCVGQQIVFDGWVRDFGLSEALEKWRMQLPDTSDKEIKRLWAEIVRVRSSDVDCTWTCFADLCGSKASSSGDEEGLKDVRDCLDFQGLRSKVKDMKVMLESSEDLKWGSVVANKMWDLLKCDPLSDEAQREKRYRTIKEQQASTNDRITLWRQSIDLTPVPVLVELGYPEPTEAEKVKHANSHKEEATTPESLGAKTEEDLLREQNASGLKDLMADLVALREYINSCLQDWSDSTVDCEVLLYFIEKLEYKLDGPLFQAMAPTIPRLSDPDSRSNVETRHTI